MIWSNEGSQFLRGINKARELSQSISFTTNWCIELCNWGSITQVFSLNAILKQQNLFKRGQRLRSIAPYACCRSSSILEWGFRHECLAEFLGGFLGVWLAYWFSTVQGATSEPSLFVSTTLKRTLFPTCPHSSFCICVPAWSCLPR